MGMTRDIAIGEFLDRFAQILQPRLREISDSEISEFVRKHNSNNLNKIFNNLISEDFFKNIKSRHIHGGKLIEKLGRYGDVYLPKRKDPPEFIVSSALEQIQSCDMSFSGYKGNVIKITTNMPKLTFNQIVNLCSSFQDSVFSCIYRSTHRALEHCIRRGLPVKAVNLCGGVACNKQLFKKIEEVAQMY
jgi:tRNA A37 threonylcarbamoyltransferase TsaD